MVHLALDGRSGRPRRSRGAASNARVWLTRHPAAVDLLIVLALAAATIGRVVVGHQTGASIQWLAVAGSYAPLALGRWAPRAVSGAVAAVAVAGVATGLRDLGAVLATSLLLALYTVAAERPRRAAFICAGVFEAWAVAALLSWAPEGTHAPAVVLMTGTATAAAMTGINHQTRRAYLAALQDRAARLDRERDQQARLAVAQER